MNEAWPESYQERQKSWQCQWPYLRNAGSKWGQLPEELLIALFAGFESRLAPYLHWHLHWNLRWPCLQVQLHLRTPLPQHLQHFFYPEGKGDFLFVLLMNLSNKKEKQYLTVYYNSSSDIKKSLTIRGKVTKQSYIIYNPGGGEKALAGPRKKALKMSYKRKKRAKKH